MIKEIFLPRSIKGYYLFPTRIVGFDIGKTHIRATQVYIKGRSTKIEKYIEMPLEAGNTANYTERAVKTLKAITQQLDSYNYIHTVLASSVVIFKELRLPFLTYDKIEKVVQYEVEPLLPFPLQESVVDFIITKQFPELASSEILVAAVQNQYIAQHLQIFSDAGISPDLITIDFFALYELYKKIPKYANLPGGIMLVDLGIQMTRIAYVQDGQLRFIRTINKGMYHQAKAVSETLDMQPHEAMEHLLRFGLEKSTNHRYSEAITQANAAFWHEMQFTLQSFTAQMQQQPSVKIILFGEGAELKGMVDFVATHLQVPCEIMRPADIFQISSITNKIKTPLPSSSIISLCTALLPATSSQANFRKGVFELPSDSIFNRQLIVALILFVMLIGLTATMSFLQIRSLRNEAQLSEHEALEALRERKHFEKALQEDRMDEVVHVAQEEVKKQKEMWFAFAGSARASVLKYLLELTKKIDKDSLGFTLDSLSIAENTLTLKAQVKDHEALKILEKELESSTLFSFVPKQEQINFTMKITLAKNAGEQ